MAKRKKKKEQSGFASFFSELKQEAVRGVFGVLLFALAAFLLLAAIEQAGVGGEFIYNALSALFGIGYFLLPLLAVVIGVTLLRSIDHQVSTIRYIAAVLFTIATLGILEVIADGSGGLAGTLVAAPLISLFELYATIIVLGSLSVGSLIVALNMTPTITLPKNPFSKEEDDESATVIQGMDGEEDEEYDEEQEPEEEEDEEEYDEEETEGDEDEEDEVPAAGGIPKIQSFGPYQAPPLSLLEKDRGKPGVGDVKANANIIKRTLQNFGITVEIDEISIGPTVTRYALKPAEGVRLSKIIALQSNLELALAASPVRIEAPIPGKALVGIEVPNTAKATIGLATLLSRSEFADSDKPLLIALGKDITGTPHYADIGKMPHALIAGTTGSGKSVMIHNLIASLLYRCGPEELRFIMVDPKRVELTLYNDIPHLLTPVITDAKKTIMALKWLAKEMERRYDILETERVRDISSYHQNVVAPAVEKGVDSEEMPERMPYIVLIIDELADIMQSYPRELEAGIVRLAQMSRAVGIHLILSTQRPSVQVITGLIKANVPARIALQVASQIDSRTILDMSGAEKLLGSGDMLFLSAEMSKPRRIQSPFVTENEVKKVSQYLAKQYKGGVVDALDLSSDKGEGGGFAGMSDDEEDDDLYEEAKRIVIEAGKASTSYIQRKLRIGYSRAARLMDILEERGVIGPADGSRPREVLQGADDEAYESDSDEIDEEDEDDEEDERP